MEVTFKIMYKIIVTIINILKVRVTEFDCLSKITHTLQYKLNTVPHALVYFMIL